VKAELKAEKSQHAALRTAHTKLEKAKVAAATEADKAKKLYKDLEATKKVVQTKLAKAEARLAELQAQPTARPDLSPFLTKALDSVKPDYTGLASLLTAARPAAQEVTRAGSASAEPTYSVSQLMEMRTLFKQ
jgi:hypothetical protein